MERPSVDLCVLRSRSLVCFLFRCCCAGENGTNENNTKNNERPRRLRNLHRTHYIIETISLVCTPMSTSSIKHSFHISIMPTTTSVFAVAVITRRRDFCIHSFITLFRWRSSSSRSSWFHSIFMERNREMEEDVAYIRWNVAVCSEWLLFISIYNWNGENEVIIFTMFRVPCTLSFARSKSFSKNVLLIHCGCCKRVSVYCACARVQCSIYSLNRVLTGFVHLLSLIYRCRATTNLLIVRPSQHNNSIRSKRLNSITLTIF